jgi:hypothetical protein
MISETLCVSVFVGDNYLNYENIKIRENLSRRNQIKFQNQLNCQIILLPETKLKNFITFTILVAFSWGLNWGFAYDLPTNASQLSYKALLRVERSIETKPMIQRRQRRDLFNRLEIAMNQ